MTAALPLKKSVLIVYYTADIQKKIYGSCTTALIISNEEMEDITKIVKLLKNQGY